jgi:hypothetical protein
MLSVIMLSAVMLSFKMPNTVELRAVMLSVIKLNFAIIIIVSHVEHHYV